MNNVHSPWFQALDIRIWYPVKFNTVPPLIMIIQFFNLCTRWILTTMLYHIQNYQINGEIVKLNTHTHYSTDGWQLHKVYIETFIHFIVLVNGHQHMLMMGIIALPQHSSLPDNAIYFYLLRWHSITVTTMTTTSTTITTATTTTKTTTTTTTTTNTQCKATVKWNLWII